MTLYLHALASNNQLQEKIGPNPSGEHLKMGTMKKTTLLTLQSAMLLLLIMFLFTLKTKAQAGEQLRISLYAHNPDNTISLNDGCLTTYGTWSNYVDMWDARKIPQIAESLSILRNDTSIAIERRKIIVCTDTSLILLRNLQPKNYHFELIAQNLNHPGIVGVIIDGYSNVITPFNLNGTTLINFSVTSSAASADVNRFKIIFGNSTVLPVKFTAASAYRNNKGISISWTTANEINMQQYEVEHSMNGSLFTSLQRVTPTGSGTGSAVYTVEDRVPHLGINFYRIKGMSVGGQIQYSAVMKVSDAAANGQITVYPNPVTQRVIMMQFTNLPKGDYTIRLINLLGQPVQVKQLAYTGANAVQMLSIDPGVAKGNYRLQIIKPDGDQVVQVIVIAE